MRKQRLKLGLQSDCNIYMRFVDSLLYLVSQNDTTTFIKAKAAAIDGQVNAKR